MINTGKQIYDCAIVGGGLAGLSLAIQLAKAGKEVILFEKDIYPQHKVCGEYISNESWDFLIKLGLPLDSMVLPKISKLQVSTPSGFLINHKLDLGGFGISRYELDFGLFKIAKELKVKILEATKVDDVQLVDGVFKITSGKDSYLSSVAVGTWGKRSNLDVKWERSFVSKQKKGLTNYVGVKYHIRTNFPEDLIALHNFKDGYCGISQIEDNKHCLCYLTTADNVRKFKSIQEMEQALLWKNPHLKKIFQESEFLFERPLVISQISFLSKSVEEHNVMMAGDSTGLIAPLCGNGMSMAFRASKILADLLIEYFDEGYSYYVLEDSYKKQWRNSFSSRLFMGRFLQGMFGKVYMTEGIIRTLHYFPFIVSKLIKSTHGRPF
ncbi:MAG: FAD-dependent monooxygenase [Opitutaceae bacterium]|nr:FAD-dependent monooxygenase [Cytophagales bacterium]